jgi:hypothetical protein
MCGIFGTIVKKNSNSNDFKLILENLAILSESRGKDSSGLALLNSKESKINVIKGNIRIKELLNSEITNKKITETFNKINSIDNNLLAFGHARLVTDGSQLKEYNNQPVIKDDAVLIHNGIIVNVDDIWQQNPNLKREFQIDTEIINTLLKENLKQNNHPFVAINKTLKALKGTYSIASFLSDYNSFLMSTNNGSLYYITDNKTFLIFASENHYFDELLKKESFKSIVGNEKVQQLQPLTSIWIDLNAFSITNFDSNFTSDETFIKLEKAVIIEKHLLDNKKHNKELVIDPSTFINRNKETHLFNLLEYNIDAIKNLKRCTKCVLPETFPFIHFDTKGVCNYCNNYKVKTYPNNLDKLNELVKPYRKTNGKQDCIVPFSGGRDSTYALHIIKEELNLNPITITYDWGMVTDLARRNIARACGELGVENILVSADMNWKRENIRKNVTAWLKNPVLGMIPLFMAGDKYFFYYTDRLKKQTDINLNIWGINHLENTDFKIGFAGLPPKFDKERIYSLSIINQMKLFGFVGKNILQSPGYINQSIIDSLGSFAVRYMSPKKDYYHLFDYYKWDENEINNLLANQYGWEKAIDTDSTWRIGDGTASFYNYIYYTVAGFSEFDTFRSNQIREGMIDRASALELVNKENLPRYETLRWYLEIIGVDFEKAIKKVNSINKLYIK